MRVVCTHISVSLLALLLLSVRLFAPATVIAEDLDPEKMGKELEGFLQQFADLGKLAAAEANNQVQSGTVSDADKAELMLLERITKMLPTASTILYQTASSSLSRVLDSLIGCLCARSGGLLAFRPSLVLS